MKIYVAPEFERTAFNCPYCEAYSNIIWGQVQSHSFHDRGYSEAIRISLHTARCSCCEQLSLWLDKIMIIPASSNAPLPHDDMPPKIKEVYIEAREIVNKSPKGASALLRLGLQMLCDELAPGKGNINDKIGKLVENGLSPHLQKAFDIVKIVGNNAVHPGEINIDDNPEIAGKLFELINLIVEKMITEPKEISAFFDATIPEGQKAAIAKRDGASS